MSAPAPTVRSSIASSPRGQTLHIVPALIAPAGPDDAMVLTQKFMDGIKAYQQRWPGDVRVHMAAHGQRDRHLDDVIVDPTDTASPFRRLRVIDDAFVERICRDAGVVLVSLIDRHLPLVHELADRGIPVVLITEQSERTREAIIRSETRNPVLRWRRQWWSHRIERRYIDAVARAAGVQCNGAPTFEAYRHINANAMFYLDNRMTADMIAGDAAIEQRCASLSDARPLRLAFSGRLVAIKGADDLPLVGRRLRTAGIDFTLDIIGGGTDAFEQMLRTRINRLGLEQYVRLKGVMDFRSQLIPYLRDHIDLFVCCHRQGDPSCTYIETIGCGVPIVGYDNEAWRGMHDLGAPGWVTRMSDPHALADRIVTLDRSRDLLATAAADARRFALDHTFEATMDRRVDHLRGSAGIEEPPR